MSKTLVMGVIYLKTYGTGFSLQSSLAVFPSLSSLSQDFTKYDNRQDSLLANGIKGIN